MSSRKLALEALKGFVFHGTCMDSDDMANGRAAIAALEVDIAQPVEPVALTVITALRFYANGSHLHIDGNLQEFDTVSGEPENWLFSCKDDDTTMLEDGSIARRALQGKACLWIEGDNDETPKPVDGEVVYAAPKEPAAPEPVNSELLDALKRIESWNEHSAEFSMDFGSNGVRDLYRGIARAAIAKATGATPCS